MLRKKLLIPEELDISNCNNLTTIFLFPYELFFFRFTRVLDEIKGGELVCWERWDLFYTYKTWLRNSLGLYFENYRIYGC